VIALASPFLWYLTRVSGLLALVLLGTLAVLGIAVAGKLVPTGFSRLLVPDLHRRLSTTLIAVLVIHVVTALADTFVHIGWWAAVVPFVARYRRAFIGFGTLALDLLLLVVATSLVRHRLGFRPWKRIHWLAWAVLGLALVHGLGSGSDTRDAVILALYGALSLALVATSSARLWRDPELAPRTRAISTVALLGVPVLLVLWARSGPLERTWASRVDGTTPAAAGIPATASTSAFPLGGSIAGTASSTQSTLGTDLVLAGSIGGTNERFRFDLFGKPTASGFVVTRASVRVGTAQSPSLCAGAVTSVVTSAVSFTVVCPRGAVAGVAHLLLSGSSVGGSIGFQASHPTTGAARASSRTEATDGAETS